MTRAELAELIVWGMVIDGLDELPGFLGDWVSEYDNWILLRAKTASIAGLVETVLRRAGVPETVELRA